MKDNVWNTVTLSRLPERTNGKDYIDNLFDRFFEMHGDRCCGDDNAIVCGIAMFEGIPVTVVAQNRGKGLDGASKHNYAMAKPEGYRKAMRVMQEAEKFHRPVILFVDTPGADAGIESEYHGQASAIAYSLRLMSSLKVPLISVLIGQGGSGGAIALAVSDRVYMLENATYSILSPEEFANILFKDTTKAREAAKIMGITADELKARNIVDGIISEPEEGIQMNPKLTFEELRIILKRDLIELCKMDSAELVKKRQERFNKY